jgi:hypothetical protein
MKKLAFYFLALLLGTQTALGARLSKAEILLRLG